MKLVEIRLSPEEMSLKEEIWGKMWVRTISGTKNVAQQPVVIVMRALCTAMTMTTRKSVHPRCLNEIGQDEGRPCESKEVDAEGFG